MSRIDASSLGRAAGLASSGGRAVNDVRHWARCYEDWVLDALGVTSQEARSQPWVHAYLKVSDHIQSLEASGRATSGSETELELGVRALVFGQRTYLLALRLGVGTDGEGTEKFVDVGAGTGGLACAAVLGGARKVELYDLGRREVELGRRVVGAAVKDLGVDVRIDAFARGMPEVEPDSTYGFGFCWNELPREERDAWFRAWQGKRTGSLWLLEPGTRRSSTGLMELRDRAVDWVVAPCRAAEQCPRRASNDWCHFTWNMGFGPTATWIMQKAGRRAHRLHCSYLQLQPAPSLQAGLYRVLDCRPGKVARVELCGAEGERRVTAPRARVVGLRELLKAKEAHQLVELQGDWGQRAEQLEPRSGAAIVSRGTSL